MFRVFWIFPVLEKMKNYFAVKSPIWMDVLVSRNEIILRGCIKINHNEEEGEREREREREGGNWKTRWKMYEEKERKKKSWIMGKKEMEKIKVRKEN